MRFIKKLPSLSRVTPGSTAVLECPVGPTYQRIIFSMTAGALLDATDIGKITVYLNGKPYQQYANLQQLMDLNGYYNRGVDSMGATAAQFALHFHRAEMMDAVQRRLPGWGTKDVQTFHIELEIAAGAPADIAITAHAQIDPISQPLGVFMVVRQFAYSSAVSGEVEIDKLPRGPWYAAVHLFKADISKVVVTADQVEVVNATKAILERTQKEADIVKRVPVTAKATHIDFTIEGDLSQCVNTATLQDWRFKPTLDTSGSVTVVTETLDTLTQAA